jgi:hypothetical protein
MQATSAFDRSCPCYRKHKNEQVFRMSIQSDTKRAKVASSNKDMTRHWSETVKASDNSSSEILALLKQQEVSRKTDSELLEKKILSYLDKSHASLQQHLATSNINSGLALNEILTKILPEKANLIAHAVNESYPKFSLGKPNAQPIITLIPTQQANTIISQANNYPQQRQVMPLINLPGQFNQVFNSLQHQQQPQQQQQLQYFASNQNSQINQANTQ